MPIDQNDMERLREIFVTRKDCDKITGDLESRINKDNIRLAVIESQLKIITWLLTAVAGGVITTLVKLFLDR